MSRKLRHLLALPHRHIRAVEDEEIDDTELDTDPPTMTPDSPSATDWQERAKQLEGWLNAAADAVGGCDLDMVASAIKVRLQSSPQPEPETDAPDFLAVVRKFYNENGYPDDMALAVGLEGCVGLAKQMYELGRSQATDATRVRDAALEEAYDAMPSTAEDPNENSYQRGRFDGIMEYQRAIRALKSTAPAPSASQKDKQ